MFNKEVKVLLIIFLIIVILVVAVVLYGWWRTYKSEKGANQVTFKAGTAEVVGLDGEYTGSVTGYTGSWQGKTMRASTGRGINRFKEGDVLSDKYPFAFYVTKSLRDATQDVVRLDYNQPENPWWLRFIVDEMVKTGSGTYLGKVHIRLFSGAVFTMGYFTLTQ